MFHVEQIAKRLRPSAHGRPRNFEMNLKPLALFRERRRLASDIQPDAASIGVYLLTEVATREGRGSRFEGVGEDEPEDFIGHDAISATREVIHGTEAGGPTAFSMTPPESAIGFQLVPTRLPHDSCCSPVLLSV